MILQVPKLDLKLEQTIHHLLMKVIITE